MKEYFCSVPQVLCLVSQSCLLLLGATVQSVAPSPKVLALPQPFQHIVLILLRNGVLFLPLPLLPSGWSLFRAFRGWSIRGFSSRVLRSLRALGLVHHSNNSFTIRVSVKGWGQCWFWFSSPCQGLNEEVRISFFRLTDAPWC